MHGSFVIDPEFLVFKSGGGEAYIHMSAADELNGFGKVPQCAGRAMKQLPVPRDGRGGRRETKKVIAREEGYTYSRSAISRSAAHDETRRRHLCYCGNE
jgi:hypothetical protein